MVRPVQQMPKACRSRPFQSDAPLRCRLLLDAAAWPIKYELAFTRWLAHLCWLSHLPHQYMFGLRRISMPTSFLPQLYFCTQILPPEDRIRVHISNTFFLSTLMGETCEVEGHSRLTRWLKKELTPLPQKDFIFIPVHHKHQHWSLAVIVNPWRAINRTLEKTTDSLRPDAEVAVSKQDTDDQQHGVLPSIPVVVRPDSSHVDGYVRRASTAGYLHRSVTKRRLGQNAGTSDVSQTSGAPHAHRGLQPKARMFHVDSMGLRSVFDRCRGRLKRFLRRVRKHSRTIVYDDSFFSKPGDQKPSACKLLKVKQICIRVPWHARTWWFWGIVLSKRGMIKSQ